MKKRNANQWTLTLCLMAMIATFFSSCGAYYPQATSMPMVDHKGALNMDGGLYDFTKMTGQASVAYGITDHIAAQAYVSKVDEEGMHYQGMAGWYTPFKNGSHVDVYAGYSMQNIRSTFNYQGSTDIYDGSHNMAFVQADYGFANWHPKKAKNISLMGGISVKAGMLMSHVTKQSADDPGALPTAYIDGNSWAIEPNLQIGIGFKWVMLNLRAGYSILKPTEGSQQPHYWPFMLGGGISVHLF